MSEGDADLRLVKVARRPESDVHSFDLPRMGAVAALYAIYVVGAGLLVGVALDAMDAAVPSTFFYHLQADEADGPLGDPMRLAAGMWMQLLAFWLIFAPLALRLRAPASLLITMTVFNEPIVLTTMVMLTRWAAGLPAIG